MEQLIETQMEQGAALASGEQQSEQKEVKRRKRFDPTLDRFVLPEERDEIRDFQEKHGHSKYPARFQKEIDDLQATRKAAPKRVQSIGVVAKPASPAKPPDASSASHALTARLFAADLAKAFNDSLAVIPVDLQLKAMELFEKKFIEYKNK